MVSLVHWSTELETGIAAVDNDHKKLSLVTHDFSVAVYEHEPEQQSLLCSLLSTLKKYTSVHFNMEEKVMRCYAYVDSHTHLMQHDALREQVNNLCSRHKSGDPFISEEILNFLDNTLVQHIIHSDKSLAEFLKSKGLK